MAVLGGGKAMLDEREHRVGSFLGQDLGVLAFDLPERLQHVVRGVLPPGWPSDAERAWRVADTLVADGLAVASGDGLRLA